jgi:hypothetical protein
MSLLILVTGILVSIVFDRQQRRHRMELMWEYRRLNLPMPVVKPKLSALQAWLNIVLGVILTALGAVNVAMFIRHPMIAQGKGMFSISVFFIGGGVTLIFLGTMALRERGRYRKHESDRPESR